MKKLKLLLALTLLLPIFVYSQWQNVASFTSENLHDVFFLNQSKGWAAGNASIYTTDDAGTNWISQVNGIVATTRYYDIYFKDELNGWAVGRQATGIGGRVQYTNDGGATWQVYFTGGSLPWWSVDFANDNQGVIVGQEGQIFYTSDGGTNWNYRSSPSGDAGIIREVEFFDGLNGIAVGFSSPSVGFIMKTTDGGNSWTNITTNIGGLNAVSFKDNLVGVAVGWNGSIYRTEDGGNSWVQIASGATQNLRAVHFNGSIAKVVGSSGTILNSTDLGLSWNVDQSNSTGTLDGVFLTGSNSGFAVGGFGEVLSYCNECDSMTVFNVDSQQTEIEELEMDNLSIAADNSISTKFKFSGNNFQDVSLRIKEDPSGQNISLWGTFDDGEVNVDSKDFLYTHPEYFNVIGEKSKDATVEVINNQTMSPIAEYPISIVRPSVLMVHGIWSDGDSFSNSEDIFGNTIFGLENKLIQNNMYDNNQILKMYYKNDAFNFENAPRYRIQKNVLKILARRENISLGKIDVIAHSNGGLLSRLYIQSQQYENDINKLITFNTPHSGSQFADLLLDPDYFFLTQILDDLEHSPTNGVISDLRVEGSFINNLRNSEQSNPSNVSLHTLTSTKSTGLIGILVENGWNFLVNRYMMYHLQISNPDDYLDDLFNTDTSDLIVASDSQKGGLNGTQTTNTDDQSHLGSPSNIAMSNKAIDLLNSNPNNINDFKIGGFDPPQITYNFNNSSGLLPNQQSNETLSINSPVEGTTYNAGDIVTVDVSGSSGIQNILSTMGNIRIPLQNHVVENSSTDNFNFTIPDNALGRLEIVSVGFDANGYADYDTTHIIVNTNAVLEGIEILQDLIYVPEGRQEFITILGNYDDGITRDITYLTGLTYVFDNQNAQILEAGFVDGVTEGEDILTVTYQGESASVPVTVANASEWVEITLSNTDISISKEPLILYPNPTSGILNINFQDTIERSKITIFDTTGKIVLTSQFKNSNSNQIDISKLNNGVYFVRIETNEKSVTKKIIKN